MENDDSPDTVSLLQAAASGDRQAWAQLIAPQEPRLTRMLALRMDPRVRSRIDPADILQDAYLEAWTHLADYLRQPERSFFVWLRSVVGHKLMTLHRRHLRAGCRDARRDLSLYGGAFPETSSAVLAAQLIGKLTRPSEAAMNAELRMRLEAALDRLEAIDREVLVLRHFEHLTNVEAAEALGIQPSAASNRYVRALKRLREVFPLNRVDVQL